MSTTNKLFSLTIRVVTLGAKFGLALVLFKYLKSSDYVDFGIISATLMFFNIVFGLELHSIALRTINWKNLSELNGVMVKHVTSVFIVIILCAPAILAPFVLKGLKWDYFYVIVGIIIVDQACLELNRYINAIGRQVEFSIVLFFRGAAWCLFLIVYGLFFNKINLHFILLVWFFSVLFALILAVFVLRDYCDFECGIMDAGGWLINNTKEAMPYLWSSFVYRFTFMIDRYLINLYTDVNFAAAYIFSMNIANACTSLHEAAVLSFSFPKFLNSGKDRVKILQEINVAIKKSWMFFGVTPVFLVFLLWYVLPIFGVENLNGYMYVVGSALVYSVLNGLSVPYQYAMYVLGRDKFVFLSNILSAMGAWLILVFVANDFPGFAIGVPITYGFLSYGLKRNMGFIACKV